MACVCQFALAVNCGYARVCIYQNSNPQRSGQYARQSIDRSNRATNFKEQFGGTYCFPEGYFTTIGKKNMTQFDRDCNKILDGFQSKFPVGADKEGYINTFSRSKWCELSVGKEKAFFSQLCQML